MKEKIINSIEESISIKKTLLEDDSIVELLLNACEKLIETYNNKGKFFAAGNGGSASDAQHIVAELVGRFYYDRPPLQAESLTTNTSNLTCIGNDYGYEFIFERQIWANAKQGDYLLALSTSGNSENILLAARRARDIGMYIVGFTGKNGGQLFKYCNINICVPSTNTARIQECHILLGHILCEMVESSLYPKD